MNKQELIERIERFDEPYLKQELVLKWIEQLEEPEKPVIPQFVADYIEESRFKGWDLLASMCFVLNAKNKKTTKWFYLGENKNIFALAWINGYTVEKEKRYLVKVKATKHFLARDGKMKIFFSLGYKSRFTRKDLEQAGFGEVFNSPLFEVEEVE